MKTKIYNVSGTGNGIFDGYMPDFINALIDFEKLIKSIRKQYQKKPNDTFDSKFRLLNNWHGEYKIDLSDDQFPYQMCNAVSFYSGNWNDLQLACIFPLGFRAPSFNGGDTKNMNIALVTTVSLGKESMREFLSNRKIPKWLKIEILKHLKDFYKSHIKETYKSDINFLKSQITKNKENISQFQESIELANVEIPKIQRRLKVIENKLKKES